MIKFGSSHDVTIDQDKIQQLLAEIQSDPMGGWFNLPDDYDQDELFRIKEAAKAIQQNSDYLVCIGIGGSYLGHRALAEALGLNQGTKLIYVGNSLSTREYQRVLAELEGKDFSINVISKSGTTTEPAIAFRLLKQQLFQKYGDQANARIYATTDHAKGALHDEAVQNHYTQFVVPDNIGGRYSVFSAVGLLPLAVAGANIEELLHGAKLEKATLENPTASAAVRYAWLRHDLLVQNYDVEVLASFEPCLSQLSEWWKQLFGESEGKRQQGIFPASVIYTTDLHSLGQYLQDGRRNIFETVMEVEASPETSLIIPSLDSNLDGLQYLEGKSLDFVNQKALEATVQAHLEGGIPVNEFKIPDLHEKSLGALIYCFEVACALSAKLSGVNPFDQPGVEAYKNNMFQLLGKPGY